jgi:hypothetical protein
MRKLPESLLILPDFDNNICNGCSNKIHIPFYHLLNNPNSIDLCLKCYDKLPELLQERNSDYAICDICFQFIEDSVSWGLGTDLDSCEKCLSRIKNAFLPIDEKLLKCNETVIVTGRDYMYKHSKNTQLVVPESLDLTVVDDFYVDYLDCIVRPPSFDWDAAEWTILLPRGSEKVDFPLTNVPGYGASCGFAIKCVPGDNKIASVVVDDHCRMAMNIVFDNVEDFFKAENTWLEHEKLPEKDRLEAESEALNCFETDHTCENYLLMRATDSFAVYLRIKIGLAMYYG